MAFHEYATEMLGREADCLRAFRYSRAFAPRGVSTPTAYLFDICADVRISLTSYSVFIRQPRTVLPPIVPRSLCVRRDQCDAHQCKL